MSSENWVTRRPAQWRIMGKEFQEKEVKTKFQVQKQICLFNHVLKNTKKFCESEAWWGSRKMPGTRLIRLCRDDFHSVRKLVRCKVESGKEKGRKTIFIYKNSSAWSFRCPYIIPSGSHLSLSPLIKSCTDPVETEKEGFPPFQLLGIDLQRPFKESLCKSNTVKHLFIGTIPLK